MPMLASGGPSDQIASPILADFIAAPRDGQLHRLYCYWEGLRRGRPMPQRADVDPTEIPHLLPFVFLYAVTSSTGTFTIRLAGEEVLRSMGRNPVGQPAGSTMTPRGAEMIVKILTAVAVERAPKFRIGKAYWSRFQDYRRFEGCFLPLASDGDTVDFVLGGVKFLLD
jgi:hypothetical protein